jgi:hypothetical protein
MMWKEIQRVFQSNVEVDFDTEEDREKVIVADLR